MPPIHPNFQLKPRLTADLVKQAKSGAGDDAVRNIERAVKPPVSKRGKKVDG